MCSSAFESGRGRTRASSFDEAQEPKHFSFFFRLQASLLGREYGHGNYLRSDSWNDRGYSQHSKRGSLAGKDVGIHKNRDEGLEGETRRFWTCVVLDPFSAQTSPHLTSVLHRYRSYEVRRQEWESRRELFSTQFGLDREGVTGRVGPSLTLLPLHLRALLPSAGRQVQRGWRADPLFMKHDR